MLDEFCMIWEMLIGSPESLQILLPDERHEILGAELSIQTLAHSLWYFPNLLNRDDAFIWGPGGDQQRKSN